MARVQLSGVVGDIRGKVGGSTFAKTNAGTVLKRTPIPVNRNTGLQNAAKNITFNIQQEWLRLTSAQRACWAKWVEFNPIAQVKNTDLFINAQQAFIKLNYYRQLYGFSILQDPVFNTNIIEPNPSGLILSGGRLTYILQDSINDSIEFAIVFLTFRTPVTRVNPGSIFKAIVFNQAPGSNSYDITDEYEEVFGIQPVPGDFVFLRDTLADKISGKLLAFNQRRVALT